MKKYFGTDGIRGAVGDSLVNPEFVLKLGWAVGKVLGGGKDSKVLIGKDTRISGYLLESLLEAGLTAAGVNVYLLGPMPTPGIAYLTRTFRAQIGVVISASHNPYYDNGIKFFASDGTKISDALEQAIEEMLEEPLKMVAPHAVGKAKRLDDAYGRYVEFCKSTMGLGSRLTGMKIVVDCAHGATYHVAPSVLQELGAEVIELGTSPDGININEGCGSVKPETMAMIVKAEGADLGVAFDGDGDRLIMADKNGAIVDGDELLFIMAKHYQSNGTLKGGIVGTVMSNLGLEQGLAKLKIPFKRAKVGDRYVLQMLQQKGWLLGGESSGHIVNLGLTTTGDGIVSALQILSIVHNSGRTLDELKSELRKFPQILINVRSKKMVALDNEPSIKAVVAAVEARLGARGRVLLRASGTEPLIRVMVEGENKDEVRLAAEEIAAAVREEVKN